jgi:hypothetical protein
MKPDTVVHTYSPAEAGESLELARDQPRQHRQSLSQKKITQGTL